MSTNVLVAYYSAYGHIFKMAQAVAEGAKKVEGADVRLRRFPELEEFRKANSGSKHYQASVDAQKDVAEVTHDDLRWADGIGGSPYGAATMAGPDNSRQPEERELTTARNLGSRVARVAGSVKTLRGK